MRRLALPTALAAALAAALCAALSPPARAASPESEEYREEVFPVLPTFDSLARRDSIAAAEASRRAADSAAGPRGAPTLPHPVLAGRAPSGPGGRRPLLAVLPTAPALPGRGGRPGETERETVAEALRLGAEQAGTHRLLSPDEIARPYGRRSAVPGDCFDAACAARAAGRLGADLLLLSELSRRAPTGRPGDPGGLSLTLALVDARTGRVRRALRARPCPGAAGPIPFVQQAVWRVLESPPPDAPEGGHGEDTHGRPHGETRGKAPLAETPPHSCDLIADVETASGSWNRIAWLNPRDTVDTRLRFAAAGAGLLAAGLGLAWMQGQLLQDDPNSRRPAGPVLGGGGAQSWLRGFFATPNPGARHAAMGGAGLARVEDAMAVNLNPAAVADVTRESVVAAKRNQPGGTPSFHLSYAGPSRDGLHQGLGIQHEGDDLANETTLLAALAGGWGRLGRAFAGVRTGAALKVYLAKVGSGGTGLDRSTGHSVGMGLDLGLKLRLSDRITAAIAVRDAWGFLRHANTFTDEASWEWLPQEYRAGAAYAMDPGIVLLMDGQKAMVADQADHLRLGAEKTMLRFLALRAGFHQAFGRQPVRKLSAGFGLDSQGISDRPLGARIALNYAYDFGLDEDEPLGTGQAFSLEVDW